MKLKDELLALFEANKGIYFSGEDLFEVHNTPNGWDPEENSGSITSYPFTRNYSFGINVVF